MMKAVCVVSIPLLLIFVLLASSGLLTMPKPELNFITTSAKPLAQPNHNVVIDSYSHAMEDHPTEAPLVRKCLEKKGPYMTFKVDSKRFLRTCVLDDGWIGFQIIDIVGKIAKERTAYVRSDITNIKQLFEFVAKKGYTKYMGDL